MLNRRKLLASAAVPGLFLLSLTFPATPQAAEPAAMVPEPAWQRRETGYITTRDGEQLRYSVLLPKANGQFPVIINYSGYDPGAIGGSAYREGDTAMSYALDQFLLQQGYAVMGVNARGTGCSTGRFDFLGQAYGEDGFDLVEFAGVQDWSNGAVGMANWSWAGMSQLMTAAEQPPHLRAIAPGMVVGDMRRDSWAPGGVPSPGFITGWRGYLHDRWASVRRSAEDEQDAQCLQQLETNFAGEDQHSITRLVFSHPLRDETTDVRAPGRHADRIRVPVFSMESFQDEAVTSRSDYYQERVDPALAWLLQTNGGHDLYGSRQMWPMLLAFLDRYVKGVQNGFEDSPRVTVWMETASKGTDYESLQQLARPAWSFHLPTITGAALQEMELFLDAGSGLSPHAPKAGDPVEKLRDDLEYPVPGPWVATYENPVAWGPQAENWQSGSLVYTSEAFEENRLLYGSASLDLWISASSADADLQVTLTEVRPDGQEMFIQRGWLRLSNRAPDPTQSTSLRPVPIDWPTAIQPLNPGQPVFARMEISKFAHAFRAGSKLRIWLDTPSSWGGYTFDYYAVPASLSVWRDAGHPSVLRVGMLDGVAVPTPLPACGQPLGQPCRSDPLATAVE
jgi:putative CocE/NonD family hydrolase